MHYAIPDADEPLELRRTSLHSPTGGVWKHRPVTVKEFECVREVRILDEGYLIRILAFFFRAVPEKLESSAVNILLVLKGKDPRL